MSSGAFADDTAEAIAWSGLVDGDYDRGVVRLATLAHQRTNHLLFASVELLPPEMPGPPNSRAAMNCAPSRLYVSRDVLPIAAALDWYQGCWNTGLQVHPGAPIDVLLGALSPEPPVRRFILRDDVPFSPRWHVMPRLHRLVPMGPLAPPVAEMVDGMAKVERYRRARSWLLDRLHFDLLAYDDWLGAIALVAPNPLFGSSRARISSRSSGQETVTVSGRPRQGADLGTVKLVFQERRVAGAGVYAEQAPDAFGTARAAIGGGVEELGYRVICSQRGLLYDEAPGWFFRSMYTQTNLPVMKRVADPPRRRRSPASKPLVTSVWRPLDVEPPAAPKSALMHLEMLQRRREDRFGESRPRQGGEARNDVRAFEDEREEAVQFIRRLVARASRLVLLVDPYLEGSDLQEFAYAAEREGIDIQALISPRKGYFTRPADDPGGARLPGEALAAQIEVMRDPTLGFGRIDVRVSTHRGLHDRFLRIDNELWHCGHSFNGVGTGEVSAMSRVTRPSEMLDLLDQIYGAAEPFDIWWARQVRQQSPRRSWRHWAAGVWRRATAALKRAFRSNNPEDQDA